jgi:N utilization substance protein B
MTRANARELAVHLVYSWEFTGEEPQQVISTRLDKEYYSMLAGENDVYIDRPSAAQRAYIDSVVLGVANRTEELSAKIQQYAIGWDISRISKLARAVLQVAIFEILYLDDVPTNVAISEAVRLVKLYDGEETSAFVNGILGSFARELNQEVSL